MHTAYTAGPYRDALAPASGCIYMIPGTSYTVIAKPDKDSGLRSIPATAGGRLGWIIIEI